MEHEEQGAEIIINRSSSKDAGIGWSIRLVRGPVWIDCPTLDTEGVPVGRHWETDRPETDEEYLDRTLAVHRRLEEELLARVEVQ